MRAAWLVAFATGAALSMAEPVELSAQGASARSRTQERSTAAERARREAERDRMRAQRERAASGRTQPARGVTPPVTRQGNVPLSARGNRIDDREYERDRRRDARERAADRINDRYYDDRYDRDRYNDRRYDYRYDDRYYDGYDWRRWRDSNTPAFCRSGSGHPVYGRQWCRDRGFDLGHDRWDRYSWGDIILRSPRDRRYDRYDYSFGRSVLGDILGLTLLSRFESYGHSYGRGGTTGRWFNDHGNRVLELCIGGVPFALLYDHDRDGRVDRVLLRR